MTSTTFSGFSGLCKTAIMSKPLAVILDPEVRVRRQNSTTEQVRLVMEHGRQLQADFPQFSDEFHQFPKTFEYELTRLHGIEGFPAELNTTMGTSPQEREWRKVAMGFAGEEKLYNTLSMLFSNTRGAFMWSGFKTETLFKVAQETLSYDYTQWKRQFPAKLDCPFSPEEKEFYGITMCINMLEFDTEIKKLVTEIMKNKISLEKSEMKAAVDATTIKPYASFLTDRQRKNIKSLMKEHLEKGFKKMKRNTLDKDEITFYMQRFFLALLKSNDEFDIILPSRASSSILQFEVKSYPQSGIIEKEKLMETLKNADHQLKKGKDLFENVLAPLANISSTWTMVGLIFLPNVKTKADLNCLQLSPQHAKFILTAEDLESDKWLSDLDLGSVEASVSDYNGFGRIFVGSASVSYRSQEVDHNKEAEQGVVKSLKRMGGANEFPQCSSSHLESGVPFMDLKAKPLGTIAHIIYWNPEQQNLMNTNPKAAIYPSEFGTGKTLLLSAAARKAAEDPTNKVMFIPATSWNEKGMIDSTSFVLNMSMEKQFRGSDVEVVTDILSNLNTDTKSILTAAQLFINKYGDKDSLKLFLDEVPISVADKNAAIAGEDSSLTRLLNTLLSGSAQVWVALRSGDLIDTAASNVTQPSLSLGQLRTHLETKTGYKVVTLDKRVRNTALVGRSVPADVMSGYTGYSGTAYSATVLPLATSHTVPGLRPVAIIGDMGRYTRRVIIAMGRYTHFYIG